MVSLMSSSDHLRGTNILHSTCHSTHLPSPISPTTQPTPVILPVASYSAQPVYPQLQWCDIAPIKGFVHKVLHHLQTSGTVLQTALCYLEAIRSKVPDLIQKEKQASSPVASDDSQISQGEVGIDYNTDLNSPALYTKTSSSDSLLATIHINQISYEADASFSMELGLDANKVPAQVEDR